MNVFYLDRDPVVSAEYHCDAHLRKMLIEYAQMLSTAHWLSTSDDDIERAMNSKLYKPTHVKHPSSLWTRSHPWAYGYVFTMWSTMQLIYLERYGKEHGSIRLQPSLTIIPQPLVKDYVELDEETCKPPPMCFGEDYKHIKTGKLPYSHDHVVDAYREYYRQAKSRFATWGKGRALPKWWLRVA